MSDLLKVKVGGSDYLCKWEKSYSVKIGGRRYKAVKIGNQLWMAENLDWKWTNLTVGGSYVNYGNPHAWYYNNDETTYGANGNKYGLLYNGYALQNIIDGVVTGIPDGWHIPSYNEFNTLLTTVGSNADLKLKSKTGWNNDKNGTDDYGFCAYPCGNIVTTGSPYGPAFIGEQITIYNTSVQSSKRGTLYIDYLLNVTLEHGSISFENAASIRLVKDAT